MTGGGIIQLAMIGIQDAPLTTNPEITFFKKVYKRHTPFELYQNIKYVGSLKCNKESTIILDKKCDLLYNQYIKLDIPYFNISKNITTTQNIINNYNIISIEIYNNNNLCYIYNINDNWYIIDKSYFNIIDISNNLYKIDNKLLESLLIPNYIKITNNSYLYNLNENSISPLINILLKNTNLWENIYLNYSLNKLSFLIQLITIKSKYAQLYSSINNQIYNNYSKLFYFEYDFNFSINNKTEVARYFEDLSLSNEGYDIDIAYKYCINNYLNFDDYKDNILPYNSLTLLLILSMLYSDNNLIFTVWKKYEVTTNNILINTTTNDTFNFKDDWTKKLEYYAYIYYQNNKINNPLFEEFKRNYIYTSETIVNFINNIILVNPKNIYIKLKTILSRFYQVPNTQLNYNNYYYSTNYIQNNLIDLYNNDNYNFQLNYETNKYNNLITNSEGLNSNEMNNLTPVDIEHIFIIIAYDLISQLFTINNLNKAHKSFFIFWRNNITTRLYIKFIDTYLTLENNGGLRDYSNNRKSTFYYSLYPSNLFLIDEFKNSYYELFYKQSWIGYLSINDNNLLNLKINIYDIIINLTDVTNLNSTLNISNNSINLNKQLNKLSIKNTYTFTYKNNYTLYSLNNLLFIIFDNYYDKNCNIILNINQINILYNNIYYQNINNNNNNILYLVISCINNIILNNNDIIDINIEYIENIPLVLFYNNNTNYPIINTKKYSLYTQNNNTLNKLDIRLFNTNLKILNIVTFNGIFKPINFSIIDIYDILQNNSIFGSYQYCISFYTINDESDISIIQNIDVAANKVVQIYNIPISENPNVIGRKIYRTKNNGLQFYLLNIINNNIDTIYIDKITDNNLGIKFNINQVINYNTLPNSNTIISKQIININDQLIITDLNNNIINFPSNLNNIYEIYIEDIQLPFTIIDNFIINNNIITINNNIDNNYLYYLIDSTNYKNNIKLVPSKKNITFKSPPFIRSLINNINNLPYTWDFANNGYYKNNNDYYNINSNGIINIINFTNIDNDNNYIINNNNLYYNNNIVISGYYSFNNRNINININNTFKIYNEINATNYSILPSIINNNKYIIYNNNLYIGNNNNWDIINSGYYYIISNNNIYNNNYIYVNKDSTLVIFHQINISIYTTLPIIGINDTYIVYNNNLYYGSLNTWNIITSGYYNINNNNNNKNYYVNVTNSLNIFNNINIIVYDTLPLVINNNNIYIIYNNQLYISNNNSWNLINNDYFYTTSNNDLYNNKYIYINNSQLTIFSIIYATYNNIALTNDIGNDGDYIINNSQIYYKTNSTWVIIKSNNFVIYTDNIFYNYKNIIIDNNGIISLFNNITINNYTVLPTNISNGAYILVNNQLYYGNNNLWNIIFNGYYLLTSTVSTLNNIYLYINNGNSLFFIYITTSEEIILPTIINIGAYIIYNNNLYLGTSTKWQLLINGNYIITSNSLYNNNFKK